MKVSEKRLDSTIFRLCRKLLRESNLNKIIDEKVVKLLRNNQPRKVDVVLDGCAAVIFCRSAKFISMLGSLY